MEQKKSPGQRLGAFFSEKGFYIVLLLSGAVVITSIWLMFAGEKTHVEEVIGETEEAMQEPVIQRPAVPVLPEAPAVEPAPETEVMAGEEELQPVWEEGGGETLPLYFIWPVSGVLERGHSQEALLYDRTMGDWRTHDGWDIQAALGAHVLAAADGTVTAITRDDLYGTTVEIDHGSGLKSYYANLAETPAAAVGDRVQVGDVIGAVGNTALCEIGEDYHLHFAMKLNGVSADPSNWLPAR